MTSRSPAHSAGENSTQTGPAACPTQGGYTSLQPSTAYQPQSTQGGYISLQPSTAYQPQSTPGGYISLRSAVPGYDPDAPHNPDLWPKQPTLAELKAKQAAERLKKQQSNMCEPSIRKGLPAEKPYVGK